MADLPVFKSKFLKKVSERIAARRKALKYFGELTWVTQQPDDFEWLTVKFAPFVGHYCIFQFVEDNRVSVFVRSKRRCDRGKVLLAIEDVTIANDSRSIVDAVEATIVASRFWESNNSQDGVSRIRAEWSRLAVRITKDPN